MNFKFDLIIKNGTCVTYSEIEKKVIQQKADIGIIKNKISKIGNLTSDEAFDTIDASHLHVLPGIIDSQVHFREPGLTHKEDIESGSRAAIMGGVTTFFEMPNTNPSTTTKALYQQKIDLSQNRSHANYAFFIGGSAENISDLSYLENLPHTPGIKIFLGSSFGNLLIDNDEILEAIIKSGQRRVIVHSEDEARLKSRKQIAIESQNPKDHCIWRDEESALISTKKILSIAEKFNRPVHILHVSSMEEMSFLSTKKSLATVEILPQYLTFSAPDCYEKWGTLAQQNPPIRDKRHLEHLWKAVNNGTVDVIGSDHAPHTLEEKNKPYPQSPSGIPGVQTLLPVMLDHVNKGRLSLEKLIELITENPRKIFKLKNKGRIEVGYDADLTLVDLKKTDRVERDWLASKSKWSIYEGFSLTGWPSQVILNGELVVNHKELLKPHQGKPCFFEKMI